MNTAKHWLSILQASFQVFLMPPYHTNVTKRLVKTPKLYFLDTGLCAYLTEWSSPETLEAGAMSGAIFETYVLAEILKSWWHKMRIPRLYYFRDRDGREIDFLFVQDRCFHPVEAKKSATPRSDWVQPFVALKKLSYELGDGGVVCLRPDLLPLGPRTMTIPVGLI